MSHIMCVVWGWVNTWGLERSKSSPQTNAPGNTPRGKARKTAGAGRWVWSESVTTENPKHFHYFEQCDLQETLSSFTKI